MTIFMFLLLRVSTERAGSQVVQYSSMDVSNNWLQRDHFVFLVSSAGSSCLQKEGEVVGNLLFTLSSLTTWSFTRDPKNANSGHGHSVKRLWASDIPYWDIIIFLIWKLKEKQIQDIKIQTILFWKSVRYKYIRCWSVFSIVNCWPVLSDSSHLRTFVSLIHSVCEQLCVPY